MLVCAMEEKIKTGGGCCLWVTVRIKGVFCEFEKLNNGSGKLKGS